MQLEGLVIPISFNTGMLLEGIKAITGLVSGAVERTQEWAEGLDQLGDVTGMSTDKLAAWSFVAKKAGVEIDTLSNATVIMAKGLLDSSGELSTTGKALEDFGISIKDAGGNVRDQSDLMNDIASKYAEFGTQTERVDFLTNVFGKSGAKLVDVFDTLAKEGGIDQVKRKVESLGLSLDPNQYEDFQRNLNEVQLTFTGLSNAFTGPLLPGASELLKTFIDWVQSPWIADGIRNIGEKLGTLASDIALGINTGNWDKFFADFEAFTGIDIQPLMDSLMRISDWVINEGIPAWNQFTDNMKTGFADFQQSSQFETSMIKQHWNELLTAISDRFNIVFGGEGQGLILDWKAIGITALQAIDLILQGLTATWNFFNNGLQRTIDMLNVIAGKQNLSTPAGYTPYQGYGSAFQTPPKTSGANRRASGGPASGLTWVGERGPELLNLPSGSQVNNNQASASMGFDYYKLAAILAVEFAKARD
ncbi:MAG: hypothetical protein IPP74_15600 [Alphaproteobacteria bacterium]|nr:hypothetical protein [Alphaproteobacteria bacterium]